MSTLSEHLCSPEELRISALSNAPSRCLSRNESIALAVRFPDALLDVEMLTSSQFVAQSGALSLTACVVTFAFILVSQDIDHRAGTSS